MDNGDLPPPNWLNFLPQSPNFPELDAETYRQLEYNHEMLCGEGGGFVRDLPTPNLPTDDDLEQIFSREGSVNNRSPSVNEEEDGTRSSVKANDSGVLKQTDQKELDVLNHEDASTCKSPLISSQIDQNQKSSFNVGENDQKETEFLVKEEENRANNEEPKVGMKFSSLDEVFDFYKKYATDKGFKPRKGKTTKFPKTEQKEETTKTQLFLCSKEGQKSSRPGRSEPKYTRTPTRTNCKARIKAAALKEGEWEITFVELEHNHELDHSHPRKRNKSEAFPKDKVGSHFKREEDTASAEDATAVNNMDFKKTSDATKMHTPTFQDGTKDARNLKTGLLRLQEEKQSFCYKLQDDADNQISNVLCWDSQSHADYDSFGDVLVLDTTFRDKCSGMVCAPFWGIDHHQKCVLFGCGFLRNETEDSFEWLLKTFNEAIGNRRLPDTFYSDVSEAIDSAVGNVFHGKQTRHRLIISHICRNGKEKLVKNFEEPGFFEHFKKCIFDCQTRPDFETQLETLREKYNLHRHSWINLLHDSWEKWSDWSCKETFFSAGIQSLFNSESVGEVIFKGSTSEMTGLNFVKTYIRKAEEIRSKDSVECKKMKLVKKRKGMERQAHDEYTWEIFKKFKREYIDSLSLSIKTVHSSANESTFMLIEEDSKNKEAVKFERLGTKISCSCGKFESIGILCSHSLKVLNEKEIYHIPVQYIKKRWKKSAKK